MRRFWLSLAVLAALFSGTLYNAHYLKGCTAELTALLDAAEAHAAAGDWDGAAELTEAAYDRWLDRETYLHMVMQHRDTDEVLLDFQEVRQLLAHREDGGEYAAANARLTARIALLYEMEQLTLKNLL